MYNKPAMESRVFQKFHFDSYLNASPPDLCIGNIKREKKKIILDFLAHLEHVQHILLIRPKYKRNANYFDIKFKFSFSQRKNLEYQIYKFPIIQ